MPAIYTLKLLVTCVWLSLPLGTNADLVTDVAFSSHSSLAHVVESDGVVHSKVAAHDEEASHRHHRRQMRRDMPTEHATLGNSSSMGEVLEQVMQRGSSGRVMLGEFVEDIAARSGILFRPDDKPKDSTSPRPCTWEMSWTSLTYSTRTCIAGISVGLLLAALAILCVWETCHLSDKTRLEQESQPGQARSAWLDNARFFFVLLVVAEHLVLIIAAIAKEAPLYSHVLPIEPLLVWISLVHAPGLAFVSGALSVQSVTKARMSRAIIGLLVPYIALRLGWWLVGEWFPTSIRLMSSSPLAHEGGFEKVVGWYTISLISWRLLAPLLRALRPISLTFLALLVGLIGGFFVPTNAVLSAHRTCSFLPFFVAGFQVSRGGYLQHLDQILQAGASDARKLRAIFLLLLVFSFVLIWAIPEAVSRFELGGLGDLYFDYSSTRHSATGAWTDRHWCGLEGALIWLHRLLRYVVSFLGIAAVLFGLVPAAPRWFITSAGTHTLYPYLLNELVICCGVSWLMSHCSVARDFATLLLSTESAPQAAWGWLCIAASAIPLTLLLSSAPVRYLCGVLLEPRWCAPLLLDSYEGLDSAPTIKNGILSARYN